MLGIGNILFGDEGIGVHLSNFLKLNYEFSSSTNELEIIDGGTLAHSLIPLITSFDSVILLDCINADNARVGDVFAFDFDSVPNNLNWSGTAHELEMLQTLKMIEILGDLPTIKIIATIPKILESTGGFELSSEIVESSKTMLQCVLDDLKKLDFEIKQINSLDIKEVAKMSFRGNF